MCSLCCTPCFSALQRAENSSIAASRIVACTISAFQCSSASRKFLNRPDRMTAFYAAEFQCSSASRKFLNGHCAAAICNDRTRFQCSSASRKFLNLADLIGKKYKKSTVSVLFSEPKIPQWGLSRPRASESLGSFSALQRAENSSMQRGSI